MGKHGRQDGFTLIELSIVLVIIGLIVGGVLVGQSLISAAGVRATISQIEKFNSAANTFFSKYGFLPGDITDPSASNFGFQARGSCPGQGNGDGLLEGWSASNTCANNGANEGAGETVMFWVDLSTAHLIDGGFSTASEIIAYQMSPTSTPNLNAFFPAAKIGRGNYIYVYEGGGGTGISPQGFSNNYFGISAITYVNTWITSNPALTVAEAYSIDLKIDDGLPQTGRVTAQYIGIGGQPGFNYNGVPSNGGAGFNSSPYTGATPRVASGASATCYDNGAVNGATQQYSVEISGGSNVNCALSFQMQAGD